ncbi:MAG: S-adenosylmethionine decarboxylase [Chloroflexi bacterium]|nr:S-adenosylmethionine decarboxylase [Chloroflexota bacterium]
MHLLIDGYEGDKAKVQDLDFVYRFLDEYPAHINMTKVGPPHVIRYVGPEPKDWGISGFVIIAESHVAVHTFPERDLVNVDIFSCMDFDPHKALKEVAAIFGFSRVKSNFIERGIVYPHDPEALGRLVHAERLELAGPRPRKGNG